MESVDLPEEITLASNYAGRMGVPARIREAKRLAERFAGADAANTAPVATTG
jgi:oxygen-dependent protoporphyrinogen oxidase